MWKRERHGHCHGRFPGASLAQRPSSAVRAGKVVLVGLVGLGGLPGLTSGAHAEDRVDVAVGELSCPPGERVGWLGLDRLECDCTYQVHTDTGERSWEFRGEPRVLSLDPEGPAAGRLRRGDQLFAVDGFRITTAEAGRRLAAPLPESTLELTVRRGGELRKVRVPVVALCPDDPRVDDVAPAAPQAPSAVASPPVPPSRAPLPARPPAAPTPPAVGARPAPAPAPAPAPMPLLRPRAILPRGWMGLSITCDDCSIQTEGTPTGSPVWAFESPPRIYAVEPGSPADQAGMARGDVLTHIDGVRLTSREGGVRFGAVQPGQSVTWTVRRGRDSTDVVVLAEDAADVPPLPDAPPSPDPPEHLRYAGEVAGAEIEVHGSSSVVVTIEPDGAGVVITTRDATIRIRDRDR